MDKRFKVNEAIQVEYKADKAATGKTIQLDVYDEGLILDAGQSGTMTEIGTTGVYTKSFTPDAVGEWVVFAYESGKPETKIIAKYSVGDYNLQDVGDGVTAAGLAIVDLSSTVAGLGSPPMFG